MSDASDIEARFDEWDHGIKEKAYSMQMADGSILLWYTKAYFYTNGRKQPVIVGRIVPMDEAPELLQIVKELSY